MAMLTITHPWHLWEKGMNLPQKSADHFAGQPAAVWPRGGIIALLDLLSECSRGLVE